MNTTTTTLGELIAEFRTAIDAHEEADRAAKDLRAKRDDCERRVMTAMENAGLEKTNAAGLSLSVVQKFRARYEPEKWQSLMRWAVDTGHEYLIQRRLTDTKVMELVDAGEPLPEGLSVEPYKDLNFRRS